MKRDLLKTKMEDGEKEGYRVDKGEGKKKGYTIIEFYFARHLKMASEAALPETFKLP